MMTIKPTIFGSHAATDEPLASVIKQQIESLFSRGVMYLYHPPVGWSGKGKIG
jgi:hypothetical protein